MKELKFRVWEEREKAYDTWPYILDESGNLFRNAYGALIGCDKKDYIIEKYTSLKDKNGKEIYEGDILIDDCGEPLEYWTVKHEYGKFVGETQGVVEDVYGLTDLRVIGNIHENADLLEELK